jgi:hypothetical protein
MGVGGVVVKDFWEKLGGLDRKWDLTGSARTVIFSC